jgi:fructose-1-phosphate kinase PfkB-like protein
LIHCTLLSPAIDVSYVVSEPFIDQTLTDLAISVTPAGKGLNVASVVRELGEDVTLHAIIPEIDLLRYTRFLDERNIRHTILPVPGSVRVNTTVLNVATNAVTHLNSAGAAVSLRFQDEFIEKISQSCNTGSYWCFSGSIPEGFDNDVYSRMIKTCNSAGTYTS